MELFFGINWNIFLGKLVFSKILEILEVIIDDIVVGFNKV